MSCGRSGVLPPDPFKHRNAPSEAHVNLCGKTCLKASPAASAPESWHSSESDDEEPDLLSKLYPSAGAASVLTVVKGIKGIVHRSVLSKMSRCKYRVPPSGPLGIVPIDVVSACF